MGGPLNGNTGVVVRWILGGVFVAIVSYFSAINAISERMTAVETRQAESDRLREADAKLQRQFQDEVMRSLLRIETDIREFRNKSK